MSEKIHTFLGPMPGLIAQVLIKKGDALLAIEVMKMESLLSAEFVGIISSILVKKGKTVVEKQLLLKILTNSDSSYRSRQKLKILPSNPEKIFEVRL